MVVYYPGTYELEIDYTMSGLTHKQRLNLEVVGTPAIGAEFTDIDTVLRDTTAYALSDVVTDYMAVFQPLFTSVMSIGGATLWKYAPSSFVKTFVSNLALGLDGTGTGTLVAASQKTWTFRSGTGGRFRATVLECLGDALNKIEYAALSGANVDYANYFLSDFSPFIARDGGYPAMCMRLLQGQNEAIFKRRYRPD